MRSIQNLKTWEAQTLPICLSHQIKSLVKFQLLRLPNYGFRVFQSFRRPRFFTHPLGWFKVTAILQKRWIFTESAPSVCFGINANIRAHQEIQCLPCAGFFVQERTNLDHMTIWGDSGTQDIYALHDFLSYLWPALKQGI